MIFTLNNTTSKMYTQSDQLQQTFESFTAVKFQVEDFTGL